MRCSLMLAIAVLLAVAAACGDDDGGSDGGRRDSGTDRDTSMPPVGVPGTLVDLSVDAPCACVTDYTLYAETGCTFTLTATAVDEHGDPTEGVFDISTALWDRGDESRGHEVVVGPDGRLSWTYTVSDIAEDGLGLYITQRGDGGRDLSSQVLAGSVVSPRTDGPYPLCVYWTDLAGEPMPQGFVIEPMPMGCLGNVPVGDDVNLHAEIRGPGAASAVLTGLIREDDITSFDEIETVDVPVAPDGRTADRVWTSRFPDPRDGVGEAEVYVQLELRDAEGGALQRTIRSGAFCVYP